MARARLMTGARAAVVVLGLAAAGSGAAADASAHSTADAKSVTIAFSNAREVPTSSAVRQFLEETAGYYCAVKPVNGTRSVAQAIADARKVEDTAGNSAVRKVDAGPDRKPGVAELAASGALVRGNTVGALAALMAAYRTSPGNGTVLADLGAVMTQLGYPPSRYAEDGIALLNRAGKAAGKPPRPMGISLAATELNDRGFALMQLGRWKAAAKILAKGVSQAPLLAEAKLNLGMALMCQHQAGRIAKLSIPAEAVNMIIAGARRGTFTTTDAVLGNGGTVTVVPAAKIIDVSHGHAGTLPELTYPATMNDVDKDGKTFSKYETEFTNKGLKESNQGSALWEKAFYHLPALSQKRILDLQTMAEDMTAGSWKKLEDKVNTTYSKQEDYFGATFGGNSGGAAAAEAQQIEDAGGNPCTVEYPKMRTWLTKRTQTFHTYMQAYDTAQRAEWAAQTKWQTGVYANIATPAINNAETLWLDGDKNAIASGMAQSAAGWDQLAIDYDEFFCTDTLGPDQKLPDETIDTIEDCPPGLRGASFSISIEVAKVSVDCEKISLTFSEPGLGPFARVSLSPAGDLTFTIGAKAEKDLGPASVGVEAGLYITVSGGSVTDVGITASAGASTKGDISLDGTPAEVNVSLANVDQAITSYLVGSQN